MVALVTPRIGPRFTQAPELALNIRRHVVRMTNRAKSSHVGTSLSMADILAVLYSGALRITPETVDSPDRDRFILSKGHGCAGLYAALAESGFFPMSWLNEFYSDGAMLAGHATHNGVPGVEVSTGSLGHGLPMAVGMALAGKQDRRDYRVVTLLSDGECDEGTIWEAALFAPQHRLDNLVVIVDYNKIQSLGFVRDTLDLEPFAAKWEAFGWQTLEIDGHSCAAIESAMDTVPIRTGRPTCIIAHTVKGKGVSFMENTVLWHYRTPLGEEFRQAMDELEVA
jgi:transketolase